MSEAASPTGLSATSMVVPIANVSTLSQAWLDALGLVRHQKIQAKAKTTSFSASPETHAHPFAVGRQNTGNTFGHARTKIAAASSRSHTPRPDIARQRIADVERMRISKKVASIHPPQPDVFRRSAGRVTIISRKGIIRLLMQRDGGRLNITAVCDPKLVSTISDALRATHLAYSARGVIAQTRVHPEKAS